MRDEGKVDAAHTEKGEHGRETSIVPLYNTFSFALFQMQPESLEQIPLEPRTLSEDDMKQLFLAFGMALRNPTLNTVLKRLTDRENRESLAAACPGLAQDPLAMALLK